MVERALPNALIEAGARPSVAGAFGAVMVVDIACFLLGLVDHTGERLGTGPRVLLEFGNCRPAPGVRCALSRVFAEFVERLPNDPGAGPELALLDLIQGQREGLD